MIEIVDRNGLAEWLEHKPREFGLVIAARSALRGVPALLWPILQDQKYRRAILLPCFRAMAIATFAGARPGLVPKITGEANVAAAAAAAAGVAESDAPINSVANAATCAVTVVAQFVSGSITDSVTNTVAATAAAFANETNADVAPPAIWKETEFDVNSLAAQLDEGIDRAEIVPSLFRAPLYNSGVSPLSHFWEDFKRELSGTDEGWSVWTSWYEARLRGEIWNPELAREWVSIPNEDWEQGPAHVNAIIKRLIEEHEAGQLSLNSNLLEAQVGTVDILISEPASPIDRKSRLRAIDILKSQPEPILAQIWDLHDRVEEELRQRRDERRNDPDSVENVKFLETLQDKLSQLSDSAEQLVSEPNNSEIETVVNKSWNLLDELERYSHWVAGEKHARTVANGVLLGGLAILGIKLGLSTLPVTTVWCSPHLTGQSAYWV